MTVRLNLSTLQVPDEGLLAATDTALVATGADPSRLCVEITETALLRESAIAQTNLTGIRERHPHRRRRLRHGYASWACLREYPVDVLKIDRSLVSPITSSDLSRRIVTGIIALSIAPAGPPGS